MWLEPVAKGGTQHAGRGPRRCAFHDEVLAVEEIGRIPPIKRKWLETGEWGENCRSPLPPIAQYPVHAKCAPAQREGIHGHGIPVMEIEVAEICVRKTASPRVEPFHSVRRAERSAVPFFFGRQRFARPARIRSRFRVADVDRPVHGQRDFFKHRAIEPLTTRPLPKHWMRDPVFASPAPVVVAPETTRLIASSSDEIEIL